MRRKTYIVILLFLSWVVFNIHRIWNNSEPVYVNPFPFEKEYTVTWHWYIYTLLKDISYILVFFALWLYVNTSLRKDRAITIAFGAIFTIHLIEIPHYILAARHSETVLFLQGLLLVWAALKISINAKKD